jgi:hypothetical protein
MPIRPHLDTVSIRPGVSILSVLRHLNYRPWFAMAEFVDNSLQSYLQYCQELRSVEREGFKLKVSIEIDATDGGTITIRDNAAGIHEEDYTRAFRAAEIPLDRSGLAEFGMGMKSAACWFAPRWSVRTKALGEEIERTVIFDIDSIVRDDLEELGVITKPARADDHYTEIVLSHLHRQIQGRTLSKIKNHLASIYRVFLRNGDLELYLNNEQLKFPAWNVLSKPFYKTPSAPPQIWKKEIDFDFGLGLRVHGFAAIFETASIANAGFALFRRNRLIQGSVDEGYRPEKIFGSSNKFTYQRLFGELHLEGFEVSHTKDGFRWEDNEEEFIDLLKGYLNQEPLPLLDQAEGHRVRIKLDDLKKGAEVATQRTAEVIERETPVVLQKQLDEPPEMRLPPKILREARETASAQEIKIHFRDWDWLILLELTHDPSIGAWLSIGDQQGNNRGDANNQVRHLGIRVSLAHPFMQQFSGKDPSEIEPLLRIGVAIALAEVTARESGVKKAGTIRRNVNELLRDALSKP